ncbi:MAG: Uma2 family endonuclease, partial [Planctomycetota bacterium]
MTVRSLPHARSEFQTVLQLGKWLETLPEPRPWAGSGEVGVRFPGRETAVGVDVAVFDAKTVADQPPPPERGEGMHVWQGIPLLAVEITSPTDRDRDIIAKVQEYLTVGVLQVWELRPGLGTATVHRHGVSPKIYAGDDRLLGDPELPGLSIRAGDLFGG